MIDSVAVWTMVGTQTGSTDGKWMLTVEIDNVTIGSSVFTTNGDRESGSSSPVWAQYTNSSLSVKQIVLNGKQMYSVDQSFFFSIIQGTNCLPTGYR